MLVCEVTCPSSTANDDAQGLPGLVELRDHPVAINVLLIKTLAADDTEQYIFQLSLHAQKHAS